MSSVVSEELITFERIPAGYLIGKVMFIASLGLDYLYMLWQSPGKRISCSDLEMKCGAQEDGIAAANVSDDLGIYVHAEGSTTGRQDVIDPKDQRQYRARVKELESMDLLEPVEEHELNWLRSVLSNDTYKGKSKGFTDDKELCMRRVTKAIKREIIKLISNPETGVMLIGVHFKDNVITGYECRYVGNRNPMSQM